MPDNRRNCEWLLIKAPRVLGDNVQKSQGKRGRMCFPTLSQKRETWTVLWSRYWSKDTCSTLINGTKGSCGSAMPPINLFARKKAAAAKEKQPPLSLSLSLSLSRSATNRRWRFSIIKRDESLRNESRNYRRTMEDVQRRENRRGSFGFRRSEA